MGESLRPSQSFISGATTAAVTRARLGSENQYRNEAQRSPLVGDEVGDGRAIAVCQASGFEGVGANAITGHKDALSAVTRAVLQAEQ